MATGHWITNRGKLLLMQGIWDDAAAGIIKMGLVKLQPVAADTEAEVREFDTVTDLVVTAGATKCDFTNYVDKTLTRTNWVEDETNNWADADASDVVWTAAGGATNNTIYGAYFYDSTTDTNDTTRLLISVDFFATPITTNGGDFTYAIADLYRAV
jgi:hypothetical protein